MAMIADRILSPESKLSCSAGMHPETARNTLAEELLKATEKDLDKIVAATQRARKPLHGEDGIGLAVGQVIGDHKMKKHFDLTITEKCFSYARRTDHITAEAALDGLYVIRTCVSSERMNSDHIVQTYKSLAKVERAFRSLKSIDLHIRPIRHWNDDRIRAHVFLCMLAYYVEWHMRDAAIRSDRHPVTTAFESYFPQQCIRIQIHALECFNRRKIQPSCG